MIDFDEIEEEAQERAAKGELDDVAAAALGGPDGPGVYRGGAILPPVHVNRQFPGVAAIPESMRRDGQMPERHPRMRLFHFYGAGDSIPFWLPFLSGCPEWLDVSIYEWPSHGTRKDESACEHVDDLIVDAAEGLASTFKEHAKGGSLEGAPFAFMGHSIGVLIMVGVAERAKRLYGLEPCCCFVMDRAAPNYGLCSSLGSDILNRDAKDFVRIFNPAVYETHAKTQKENTLSMLRMWMADIRYQNQPKPEGFHYFRCPVHVGVAMLNWANDDPAVRSKMDEKTKTWHQEWCSIVNSSESSSAIWDFSMYEDWSRWSNDCHIHKMEIDHTNLKTHAPFFQILFGVLEPLRVGAA